MYLVNTELDIFMKYWFKDCFKYVSFAGAEDEKPKPNLEANMDSFESLFAQLASMKEKSSNLSPADRKLYAEQVAMSFYAAMGSSDDEFDDVNDI